MTSPNYTYLSKYRGCSQVPTVGSVTRQDLTYAENLTIGEYWEDVLVAYLRDQGLDARRPCQTFDENWMYPKYQRDIDLWVPLGDDWLAEDYDNPKDLPYREGYRPVHIEVKSRKAPFGWETIDAGKVSTWDSKTFPVAALVIIDQLSGKAAVVDGDRSLWLKRRSNDYCYTIPTTLLTPLEAWVDLVKDGLYS